MRKWISMLIGLVVVILSGLFFYSLRRWRRWHANG